MLAPKADGGSNRDSNLQQMVWKAMEPKWRALHWRQWSDNTDVVEECRDAERLVLCLTTILHLMLNTQLQRKKKSLFITRSLIWNKAVWMFTGMPLTFYSVMSFNLAFTFIQDLVIFTSSLPVLSHSVVCWCQWSVQLTHSSFFLSLVWLPCWLRR